jgi:hypothetical protein
LLSQFLRPYAAKAIIQHEFVTDHLDIYITFRFAMDQTVSPANNLWLCKVDSVLKAVTASAWQDAWTMLLTVDNIASIPERVTLEYNGPNQNLRITWDKQWEPWGPIVSEDGSLLPYGSFKGNEINWTQVAAQDIWYTIADADISAGPIHKITFELNRELKVSVAGYYTAWYYLSIECSIAGKHVLSAFEINGVEQDLGKTHHEFGRANEEITMSAAGLFLLAVNDVLSVGVSTTDAGNPTLTVQHVGLVTKEIGKT